MVLWIDKSEYTDKILLQMSAPSPSLAAEEFYLLHENDCVCCLAHPFIDLKKLYSILTVLNTVAA